MIRELILRAWYATQHGPDILDKITAALDETPSAECPFCRARGHHETSCYLMRRLRA